MLHASPLRRSAPPAKVRPTVEQLESRFVPYSVSGGSWIHPELITISFVPDGTQLSEGTQGPVTSTMFADFNARFGSPSVWQNAILKGAQVFARQTNVNFAVVSDNGSPLGHLGAYQQGDPNYGDIRIGAARFTGFSFLAGAYAPQPINNYSIAGDFYFNTEYAFSNGTGYDLFTIAAHEVGHALGLSHSEITTAIMAAIYPGVKTDLTTDDVSGIRSIYSAGLARTADVYDTGNNNNSFSKATVIPVDPVTKTGLITDMDITTTADSDFFKITIPSGTNGTLKVTVQSAGLSLLAPKLYLYNSAYAQKGYANGTGQYGTTLSLTLTGVSAGQVYYVKVVGADTSAFGTGKYGLTVNTGPNADPVVPLPNTQTPNGSPLQSGGLESYDPNGHGHDHGVADHGDDVGTIDSGVREEPRGRSDGGDDRPAIRKDNAQRQDGPRRAAVVQRLWEAYGASIAQDAEGANELDPIAKLLRQRRLG